jgi:hypothetical protein
VICAGGSHAQLFAKIDALNSKSGPFDVLITGDLFADDDGASLLDGSLSIHATCYFTTGGSTLPAKVLTKIEANHGEVAPNLVFLGWSLILLCFSSHSRP